ASEIASIIRGKRRGNYTPNVDCGDNVIVINSDKIRLTGKKWTDKEYVRHTSHPGGQRFATPKYIKDNKSSKFIVEMAVKGMLPKNRLGRKLCKNLYVYEETKHPHVDQKAKEVKIQLALMEVINTIGRRKTAVARIYIQPGNGNIQINGKDYKVYFPTET